MKGRPPTQNRLLALRGSRHQRAIDSGDEITNETVNPPADMRPDVRHFWNEYTTTLKNIREADRMMLVLLCETRAAIVHAEGSEQRFLRKQLLELAREFGMTPLSRQRAGMPTEAPTKIDARKRE